MSQTKLSKKDAIVKFFTLIKPYWHLFLLSIIFSTLASFITGAIAWLVKPLFDKVFLPQNYHYFFYLPFIVAGIFFLRAFCVFSQAYFMKKASYSLGKELRKKIPATIKGR